MLASTRTYTQLYTDTETHNRAYAYIHTQTCILTHAYTPGIQGHNQILRKNTNSLQLTKKNVNTLSYILT